MDKNNIEIGDRVKVVRKATNSDCSWGLDMDTYIGKEGVVTSFYCNSNKNGVYIDSCNYGIPIESLEPVFKVGDKVEIIKGDAKWDDGGENIATSILLSSIGKTGIVKTIINRGVQVVTNDTTLFYPTSWLKLARNNNSSTNTPERLEVLIPDGYVYEKHDDSKVTCKLKQKSLVHYIDMYCKSFSSGLMLQDDVLFRGITTLTYHSSVDEFIRRITKGQAIDILQLIANDYNGDWKYKGGTYYHIILCNTVYYWNTSTSNIQGKPMFKDNTFDFTPHTYLLDKIYKQ